MPYVHVCLRIPMTFHFFGIILIILDTVMSKMLQFITRKNNRYCRVLRHVRFDRSTLTTPSSRHSTCSVPTSLPSTSIIPTFQHYYQRRSGKEETPLNKIGRGRLVNYLQRSPRQALRFSLSSAILADPDHSVTAYPITSLQTAT